MYPSKAAPPPYQPPGVNPPPPGYYPPSQPHYPAQETYPPPPHQPQPHYPQPAVQEVHFHAPPARENTVIIETRPGLGPVICGSYGPNSTLTTCAFCHHTITTDVRTEASMKTHLVAFIMCLFVCWPCCLLPYCMSSCQSKNHYCAHCGAFLGSYDG